MFDNIFLWILFALVIISVVAILIDRGRSAKIAGIVKNDIAQTNQALTNYKWNLVLFGLTLCIYLIGEFVFSFFLAFAAGTFASSICLLLFNFADSNILGSVDTKTEIITNRNYAYAIYLLAIAITIVIPFAFTFIVFLTLSGNKSTP